MRNRLFSLKSAFGIWICHILVALYWFYYSFDHVIYAMAGTLVVFASLPYLVALLRKKFIPYEPCYLLVFSLVIHYTAILFLSLERIPYHLDDLLYLYWHLSFAILVFLLGYYLKFGKKIAFFLPHHSLNLSLENLVKLPKFLYGTAWSLRILPFIGFADFYNTFRGWQIVVILVKVTVLAGLFIDFYISFTTEKTGVSSRVGLFRGSVFLILEIFYGFTVIGMKESILIPLVFVFLAYIKGRKKIPYVWIIIFIVLSVFVIMPFVQMHRFYRMLYYNDSYIATKKSLEDMRDPVAREIFQERIIRRIANPVEIAMVCKRFREEGREISTYGGVADYILRFIPRFLMPDKPSVDYNRIGKELGIIFPEDDHTSVGITLIAGMILSYDTLGIYLGMFLLGILLRMYWEWLIVRSAGSLLAFVVYFNLIYTWLRLEEFAIVFHSNMSFLAYTLILTTLVLHYTSRN